jgi:hypothetical protein
MKRAIKSKPKRGSARDLFAELSEGTWLGGGEHSPKNSIRYVASRWAVSQQRAVDQS